MEAVAVASSFAGLLTLTSGVIQLGYTYIQTARKWHSEVRAITKEIIQLSGLLHTLQPLVDEISRSRQEKAIIPPAVEVAEVRVPLEERQIDVFIKEVAACNATLEEVDAALRNSTPKARAGFGNASKRLLWLLKKPELMGFLDKLERHKATFDLSLTTYGTYIPC